MSHTIKLVKEEDPFYESYGLYISKIVIDDKEQTKKLVFKNVNKRLIFIDAFGSRFFLFPNLFAKQIVEDALRSIEEYNFSIHKQVYHDRYQRMMSIAYVTDKTIGVANDDKYRIGFYFTNSEDGNASLKIGSYLFRVKNSAGIALHDSIVKYNVQHSTSLRKEYDKLVSNVKKMVLAALQDGERFAPSWLEQLMKIKLNDKIFSEILFTIPYKALRLTQVCEKADGLTIVFDETLTLYDVLCRVSEFVTYKTKPNTEYQLITETAKLTKILYKHTIKKE